jgi:signal transduction histidine kinase
MRRITEEFRSTLLDNVGLLAALRWQFKDMCRRLAIRSEEHTPETEPQLTPAELISIFRVGQESLLVAGNQANVSGINFTLRVERDRISFGILANGSSELPQEDSLATWRLALLRQRVAAMGGTVEFGGRAVGGIHLDASIPLTEIIGPWKVRTAASHNHQGTLNSDSASAGSRRRLPLQLNGRSTRCFGQIVCYPPPLSKFSHSNGHQGDRHHLLSVIL